MPGAKHLVVGGHRGRGSVKRQTPQQKHKECISCQETISENFILSESSMKTCQTFPFPCYTGVATPYLSEHVRDHGRLPNVTAELTAFVPKGP